MIDLSKLDTEQQNQQTMNLDQLSVREILTIMNNEDKKVPLAIEKVLPAIEQAVKIITKQLQAGGRLIYTGAGTSGRLGVLDASECPPTFGAPKEQVIGMIAGGKKAFTEAIEGSEDDQAAGARDLKAIGLTARDVVVGLAASGRTPYVVGALEYANAVGASTVAIACTKESQIGQVATVPIEATPGPEVLTGSTRLKAGSAQKMILNMLSTVSMIGIGKVYKNLMVDVQPTNAKLIQRSKNIIMKATGADLKTATEKLVESDYDVKVAILMVLLDVDKATAVAQLEATNGHVRQSLEKE